MRANVRMRGLFSGGEMRTLQYLVIRVAQLGWYTFQLVMTAEQTYIFEVRKLSSMPPPPPKAPLGLTTRLSKLREETDPKGLDPIW